VAAAKRQSKGYKDVRDAPPDCGIAMSTAHPPATKPPFALVAAKALPTVQPAQVPAVEANKGTADSAPSSEFPATAPRNLSDGSGAGFISEQATLALIRRTLLADGSHGPEAKATSAPIEGVLPPLTSSNDVDVQLYAIVAIVIKDFVNIWYSKITPDRTFVDEVIQVVAHVSRAIEQRIRDIDVTEVVLDELPVLIEKHITGEHRQEHVVMSIGRLTTTFCSIPRCHHCICFGAVWDRRTTDLSFPQLTSSLRPGTRAGEATHMRSRLPTTSHSGGFGSSSPHRGFGQCMSQNIGDRHHLRSDTGTSHRPEDL
jgi:hypothetical protein